MEHMHETRQPPNPTIQSPLAPQEVLDGVRICRENPVLQALVATADHPAFILDSSGRILAASRHVQEALRLVGVNEILSLTPGQALRCHWAMEGSGGCGTHLQCRTCGIALSLEECRHQDTPCEQESLLSQSTDGIGTLGEFRMSATPLLVDGKRFVFLSVQDIGDRKRLESLEHFFFHQVLNLTDGLDGTVRILAAEPESAPHLVRQLADFTQQLSQEVHGQRILLQAENGSLQPELREIDVAEIMESLGAFFSNHDVTHKRHLDMRPFRPERFRTDPTLLLRILVDLVMNAFEATPVKGTVRVEYQREGGDCTFVVQNPVVIPPDIAARIFQRSFTTKASGGRGLGTFGLRLLTERYLGGRLDFTTGENTGTQFTLRLPAEEPLPDSNPLAAKTELPSPVPPPQEEQEEKEKLGTVLVVDDTRIIRHLLQAILSKDFHVVSAENGREALVLAQAHMPDLILLDVVMTGMDGYAVCRHLKANPKTTGIPIVFLTALTGKADETRALEAGATDFVTKPINPDVVYARVRKHVEMKLTQEHLKDLSMQDGMTGIANRRAFDQSIEYEWRRGIRSRRPLSVIMGDVDFFKRYNDGLGHQQGDVCLQRVAHVFAQAINRPSDTAARYGGEEFVCVLGETDEAGALLVAERICEGVEALGLPHPASDVGPCVTVSLGVATTIPDHKAGFLSLVEEADRNLYEAKQRGRNRVVGPSDL